MKLYYFKKIIVPVCLMLGVLGLKGEPLLSITGGDLTDPGKCRLLQQADAGNEPDGFYFNGKTSFLFLQTPQKLSAATFALQVNPAEIPADNGAFISRRGFHNIFGIDKDGKAFFEIWSAEKKQPVRLQSTTVMKPGSWYNLAAVVRPEANGKTCVSLYAEGKVEAETVFDGTPYPYDGELIVGATNPWGDKFKNMFHGKLNAIKVFSDALDASAVAGLLLPPPVAPKVTEVVSVADFGAVPGDGKDDTAAVQRAIGFMLKHQIKKIVFPRGKYDFFQGATENLYDKSHWVFYFNNIDGIEIDGNGSTFILHGLQFFVYSSYSSNITFKNLTIDYERPFFSIGKVFSLAPDKRSFEIDLDPRYQVKGGEKVEAFLEMDPVTGLPASPGLDVYYRCSKTELAAPQRLRVHMTDTIEVTPGKIIMLRHDLYTASLFRFLHGRNIVLENIDIHMASGMGIVGQYINGFTARNVRILPRPGSPTPMSIPSDGMNLLGCQGKILVENCFFDGMGDDCLNIFTNYWSVKEVIDSKTCVIYNGRHNSRETPQEDAGDVIDFMNGDTLKAYASRKIEKIVPDFKTYTARVVFTEDLPVELKKENDLLMKQNRIESVIIRNSFFRALRGRGICIQVPNVTIEDNRFQDTHCSGIHISTVISPWFEAGPADHVTIRNNEFINCMRKGASKNSAVIQINAVLRNRQFNDLSTVGIDTENGVHRNIKILNNKILGSNNGGMVINSVEDVEVRGNLLQNLAIAPLPTWNTKYLWSSNAVTMLGAHKVVFAENRYVDTVNPEKSGVMAIGEGCDRDDIKLSGNSGFDVKYGSVLPAKK